MLRCPACGQFDVTNAGKCLTCGHRQAVPETPPAPAPSPKRGRGRPRKHPVGFDRAKAWREDRQLQKDENHRKLVGLYLRNSELWKVDARAKEWHCSKSAAVTRLLSEAAERYTDILFRREE